jgi:hypothetical protein
MVQVIDRMKGIQNVDDNISGFDDLAAPWWCPALGVFIARSILILFVFNVDSLIGSTEIVILY